MAEEEIQLTLGREWRHREARAGDAADDGWKGGERGRRAEHVVSAREQLGAARCVRGLVTLLAHVRTCRSASTFLVARVSDGGR